MHAAVLRHTLGLASEGFVVQQAERLPCRVTLLARDPVPPGLSSLKGDSISRLGRSAVLAYTAGSSRPLIRLLETHAPDVIHAHFGVEGASACKAAAILGIPLVTTFHGFDATRTTRSLAMSRHPAWMRFAIERRRFVQQAPALIAVSQYLKNQLIRLGAAQDRITVIATGVDTHSLQLSPLPQSRRIVHVARLVEVKGTSYLIKAFGQVLREHPDTLLEIIGDGPLRPSLENLVQRYGLQRSIHFRGAQSHSEVLAAIRSAYCLALPSVTARSGAQEGLGQVLLEAGALGRPVIATRHGGIPEAVDDGGTGLLVPEKDVASLALALRTVIESPDLATEMGLRARDKVVRKFDLTQQACRVEQVYQTLLG